MAGGEKEEDEEEEEEELPTYLFICSLTPSASSQQPSKSQWRYQPYYGMFSTTNTPKLWQIGPLIPSPPLLSRWDDPDQDWVLLFSPVRWFGLDCSLVAGWERCRSEEAKQTGPSWPSDSQCLAQTDSPPDPSHPVHCRSSYSRAIITDWRVSPPITKEDYPPPPKRSYSNPMTWELCIIIVVLHLIDRRWVFFISCREKQTF